MAKSRYAIYRYQLIDDKDDNIHSERHFDALEVLRGEKAFYRVRDPQQYDFKHFVFDVEQHDLDGTEYLTFGVGYQITERPEIRLDPATEKLALVMVTANDMRATRAVFLPQKGVAAFRDGSGDSLNATGGAGRVKAIFDLHFEGQILFEVTARQSDVNNAMRNLKLVEMTFDVRPFNPHPRNPGLRLSELMKVADVGKLSATAKPFAGGRMTVDDGGLVSEAQGLSKTGYGQFGIKAETNDGSTVDYKKPTMKGEKEKDQDDEENPKQLRIGVESSDAVTTEEERIVRAIMEIFVD